MKLLAILCWLLAGYYLALSVLAFLDGSDGWAIVAVILFALMAPATVWAGGECLKLAKAER